MPAFGRLSRIVRLAMIPTLALVAACFPDAAAAQTRRFFNYTTTAGLGSNTVRGIYASGSTVYAATSSGLSISTDGGMNYTNYPLSSVSGSATYGVYAVGSAVYVATDGGLAVSNDGGLNYTLRTTAAGLGANIVNGVYASGSTVYAATISGLSVSTNGGTNFTTYRAAQGLGNNSVDGVYASGGTIYAATAGGLSISTTGTSFTNSGTASGLGSNTVKGTYAVGSTVYAATRGGLSISTDGGSSYTNYTRAANGLGNNDLNGVFASEGTIYAATNNGGLSISTNGGTSFTNYTASGGISPGGLGGNNAFGVYVAGDTIYVATNGGVSMSVLGPLALTWSATNGTWNTQASQVNWQTRGTASTFYVAGDAVTFGQTVGGTVTLSGSLAPSSVAVTAASGTYTFNGNILSLITGSTGLTKSGEGTLVLSSANSYTGTTALAAGTLRAGANGSFGSGVLDLDGGTLASNGAVARAFANPVTIGGDVVFGDATGTGALTFSGNVDLGEAGRTLTTVTGVTISGTIGNGSLTKQGAGTLTLAANNSYTGLTWVRTGTLVTGLANALAAASDLTVDSGATCDRAGFSQMVDNAIIEGVVGNSAIGGLLTVTGTLSGSGVVNGATLVNGVHAPGSSPGIQTFTSDLTYGNAAVVNWELTDNTASNSPVVYDQIVLTGVANLAFNGANVLALSFNGAGSLVDWNDAFWDVNRAWTVFDLAAGVTTGFGNLSLGGSLFDSNNVALDGATRGYFSLGLSGQDVVLQFTAVPEPATSWMALAGMACGGFSLWRRRKRA